MNMRSTLGIVASVGFALCGCNSGPQRSLRGQINLSDYGLAQPAVLVESSNHLSYVANVSTNGNFSIGIPLGVSYRLTLTDRTSAGPLALESRILWTAKSQHFVWGKIATGPTIDFGLVRPLNLPGPRPIVKAGSQGNNGAGQLPNDDGSGGGCQETDDDGSGSSTCSPTPSSPSPSSPPLCMPGSGGMGDSAGNQDDDCQKDNQSYGEDDRDGNGGSGTCGDGGTKGSGGGDDKTAGTLHTEDDGEGSGSGHGCLTHVPNCPNTPGSPPDMATTGPVQ